MKIIAYVEQKIEMEVDDKFAPLLTDFDAKLTDELIDIILADDNVIGVNAIWDETNEICICEC